MTRKKKGPHVSNPHNRASMDAGAGEEDDGDPVPSDGDELQDEGTPEARVVEETTETTTFKRRVVPAEGTALARVEDTRWEEVLKAKDAELEKAKNDANFALTQAASVRDLADKQLAQHSEACRARDEATSAKNTLRTRVCGVARALGWGGHGADENGALAFLEQQKPQTRVAVDNANSDTARQVRMALLGELESANDRDKLIAFWRSDLGLAPPAPRPPATTAELEKAANAERQVCFEIAKTGTAELLASLGDRPGTPLIRNGMSPELLAAIETLESVRDKISARNLPA